LDGAEAGSNTSEAVEDNALPAYVGQPRHVSSIRSHHLAKIFVKTDLPFTSFFWYEWGAVKEINSHSSIIVPTGK
jgi:hypothetical protein